MSQAAEGGWLDEMSQLLLAGAVEILGPLDAEKAIRRCKDWACGGSASWLCSFQAGLEETYGTLGGCGIALRVGRVMFNYLLRGDGEEMGLTGLEFRLRPTPVRLRIGLERLAGKLGELSSRPVRLLDEGKNWSWQSVCCEGEHGEAGFYCTIGIVQEFLSWAGGGKFYPVAGLAEKGAYTLRINKQAVD